MMTQIARHCLHHLVLSLWRRKTFLLAAVLGTSLVVICLQYGSVGENVVRGEFDNHEFPLGLSGSGIKNHHTLIPRRNLSAVAHPGNKQDGGIFRRGTAEIREGRFGISRRAEEADLRREPRYQPVYQHEVQQDSYGQNQDSLRQNNAAQQRSHYQTYDGQLGRQQQQQQQQSTLYRQQGRTWQQQGLNHQPYYIPPLRLVHIDLKGAPPKISYFKQIFPMLKDAGANGILLEYEDMFPFWGQLAPVAARNHYTKEDVKTILSYASTFNFEVIPLVQTFGHLEFVLKIKNFQHLREVDDFPQALCPSKNSSFNLVQMIIDQVMSLHSNSKWLHIGCDEVYHLGYCPKCMRQDRDNLFLSHVERVARYVREKHNIIPIIWDDMLRQMTSEKLKEFQLGNLVEPMVWTYVKDVYRFIPYNVWLMYSEVFPFIWSASAFKGAFGETLTIPNVKMHLENNEAWLEVMDEQQRKFTSFRGIVITGWQRYDHLATLCELLPASMPSLILNLLTVSHGYFSHQLIPKFQQILQCTIHSRSHLDLDSDPHLWQKAASCFFPGSAVFRLTQHHSEAIKRVNDYLYDITIHKAWLTEYNVRHNISSPMRVDEGLADYSSIYFPLTSLVRTARDALREVFDEYTVSEWIEQNIYPYITKMEKVWKEGMELKKQKTWPVRPLPPLEELKQYSVGLLESNDENKV